MKKEKCIIIGSGPSGYTAAIYAARAGLNPKLYQGSLPGGQLTTTTEVENYPGYPNGIMGPQMMAQFEEQARNMGADIISSEVTSVDFSKKLKLEIDGKEWIESESIIISTGANARWLGIENEKRLNGYGVSACAVCDGFFFKGRDVAIVGAGDTAAEEALYLSKICNQVNMIVRSGEMRASKIMQNKINNTKNIKIYWNSEVRDILGSNIVESIVIENNIDKSMYNMMVDAIFIAIGHTPNSSIFNGWIDMDDNGYIRTIPGTSKTNIDGVFASGDVQDRIYRQAITAAASGCMAALDAEKFLNGL